jgi:hypothetical protein
MNIQRIAAFSNGEVGGNPAGVVLCEVLPEASVMQKVQRKSVILKPPSPLQVKRGGGFGTSLLRLKCHFADTLRLLWVRLLL